MSGRAVGWVLRHSPAKNADRMVLVVLAEHSGDDPNDGAWESYPGIETIRIEAGLDRTQTVRDALARLVESGAIERRIKASFDDRIRVDRRPNLYRIRLDAGIPDDCEWCSWARSRPHVSREVDESRPHVSRDHDLTNSVATTSRIPRGKPSGEPSVEPTARGNALFDVPTNGKMSKPPKSAPPPSKRTRKPDLVFETVAEVCGIDWRNGLTRESRGPLTKSVVSLKQVGATPEEIRARADRYRRRFRDAELSPTALAKWWPSLGSGESSTDAEPSWVVRNAANTRRNQ